MNRKGISPILASVLLLAVTISVVGIFSGWAPQVAQNIMGQTEQNANQSVSCSNDASVTIVSGNYDGSSSVTLAVRNTGDKDLNNLILAAFYSNNTIMGQSSASITAGKLSSESISSLSGKPAYIKAFSQECPRATDRLDL
ncbi:MAG: archaellin/type IV pilin N-terminal domain-containing protein [Candidatus Nanohaloarchaea archaeon]